MKEIPAFLNHIKSSFRYLVDECGFRILREGRLPHFLNAEVVFQSADCLLRAGRDVDTIYVDASSISTPDTWWPLSTVVEYMTKRNPLNWYDDFPAHADSDTKENWLIARMAEVTYQYCASIREFARQGGFEQQKEDLTKILMRLPQS